MVKPQTFLTWYCTSKAKSQSMEAADPNGESKDQLCRLVGKSIKKHNVLQIMYKAVNFRVNTEMHKQIAKSVGKNYLSRKHNRPLFCRQLYSVLTLLLLQYLSSPCKETKICTSTPVTS